MPTGPPKGDNCQLITGSMQFRFVFCFGGGGGTLYMDTILGVIFKGQLNS